MKTKTTAILMCFALLMALANSFVLPPKALAESNIPDGYNLYQNDTYGFSMAYPSNLTANETPKDSRLEVIFRRNDDSATAYISLNVIPGGTESIQEATDSLLHGYAVLGSHFLKAEITNKDVNGISFGIATVPYTSQQINQIVMANHNGILYKLQIMANKSDFSGDGNLSDTIINSIRFTNISETPSTEKTITVTIDGKPVSFDQPPIIQNGRTLVPMRAIFEEMGATVDWNGDTQTVTGTKGDIVVIMQIGNNVITKNGQKITLDVPPQLVNSRTLVPVRAVAESFNAIVDWNDETQTVIITTGGTSTPTSTPTPIPTPEPTPTPIPTPEPTPTPTKSDDETSELEKRVFELVNEERKAIGLNPYIWSDEVAAVARAHSKDMWEQNYFAHISPDGKNPYDRLLKAGISGIVNWGENCAGGNTPEMAMQLWMNSPGHKANILNSSFAEIGVGLAYSENGSAYWTQVFITR